MKRTLALVLAVLMVVGLFAGCGSDDTPSATAAPDSTAPTTIWDELDAMDYEEASDTVYGWNLGSFYEYYTVAKEEVTDLDRRLALMAIAEAKLMESGAFIPMQSDGGSYAMRRMVPRSYTTTDWGMDEYRWYTQLVANELILAEDLTALTALWSESPDAATWLESAKAYMDEHGYTLKDTYNTFGAEEIMTWDGLATSKTSDGKFIAATWSPLLAYDAKNVQQPALAESYEVSEDGLTYTFHIRQGVNWVDQQGRVIGEVTANDWVTAAMHMADNNDALGYLYSSSGGCGIKNYDAFINGEVTDFSEVGVQAVDDYTLVYTLEAPFPAFVSMLGYSCFMPLNYDFYKSQGGTFGAEGDEYTAGSYGTSPSTIAYCGPYLVTNYTEKNVISFAVNPEFYDLDSVNISYVNYYFNDGTDTTRSYNEAKTGVVDSVAFNASTLVLAKEEMPEGATETYFDLYAYTTNNSATTWFGFVNLNRGTWTNFNDTSVGVSPQTEEDAYRTRAALNNQSFRLALSFAFDRGAYFAVSRGEELKYNCVRNSCVPGTFNFLSADTTVEINGESVTFPAGTYYGAIMQAQIDADGYPITVWDPNADDGIGSGDGFDGWYNPDNAVAYLETAIAELAEEGIEVSAENPIYIDVPYGAYSEINTNQHQAYKQSIEGVLGGAVMVNLIGYADSTSYDYCYYRITSGAETNFDLMPSSSGWGPDYGDPQTYLDTLQPYGYMVQSMGMY